MPQPRFYPPREKTTRPFTAEDQKIKDGKLCAKCGLYFAEAQGRQAVCRFCWPRLKEFERGSFILSRSKDLGD